MRFYLTPKFLPGTYTFKMAINPEYKVPEITFENNAALCTLYYRWNKQNSFDLPSNPLFPKCVSLFSYVFLFQPNDCSDQQLYSRPTLTESRSQSTVFTFNAYFQFVPTIIVFLRRINVFRCTPNIFLLLTTFTPNMHVELGVQCLVTSIGCGSNSWLMQRIKN